MTPPIVRVGVGDYDHTRDLLSQAVPVEGVRFTGFGRPEDLFSRFLETDELDAAELSLAVTTVLAGRNDDRFVALPIFPARSFRHGAFYTTADGPRSGEQLQGARIGIPVWAQTAGVYARGILASRYDVDLSGIEWICAGIDVPGRREPVDVEHGPFTIRYANDATLNDLLLGGEVDAVISARPPACIEDRDPRVRRLFEDSVGEERDYFRETGVFPIMHVVVVRREVCRAQPSLAGQLMASFEEAKQRSLRRALAATVPSFPLPWASSHAREARRLIGDDFWPYGIANNRPSIDAFLGFAADQHLTPRRLSADELFAGADLLQPLT